MWAICIKLPGWIIALLSTIILLSLMVLADKKGQYHYTQKINQIKFAAEYAGQPVCLSYLKIISVKPDQIIAADGRGYHYRMIMPNSDIIMEDERYSVSGRIRADGFICIEQIQHHPYRTLKYLISACSLVIVCFLLIRYFRINKDGIIIIRDMDKPAFRE